MKSTSKKKIEYKVHKVQRWREAQREREREREREGERDLVDFWVNWISKKLSYTKNRCCGTCVQAAVGIGSEFIGAKKLHSSINI